MTPRPNRIPFPSVWNPMCNFGGVFCVVLLVSCGAPAALAPSSSTAGADRPATPIDDADPGPTSACQDAIRETVTHARALYRESPHATLASVASITDERFRCVEPNDNFDLDADGDEDIAVTEGGGATMRGANAYFLFLQTDDGPVFVGHVDAHPITPPSCARAQSNGLCDVYTGELMIHGEEVTHLYRYDGTRYQDAGVVHQSPPEPLP